MSSICLERYSYNPEALYLLFYIQPYDTINKKQKTLGKCYYFPLLNKQQWGNILTQGTSIAINKADITFIINSIKSSVCTGLTPAYITRQFSANKIFMVLYDRAQPSHSTDLTPSLRHYNIVHKPVGFILGHYKHEDDSSLIPGHSNNLPAYEAYIDIICSCPGSGKFLLEQFITFAESNNFNAISLSSLPNVLGYYPKFDFLHRHSCNVVHPIIPPPRFSKTYKNSDDTYLDDEYYNYMIELKNNKFGRFTNDCEGHLTKEQLATADCGSNGYKMRRCIPPSNSS